MPHVMFNERNHSWHTVNHCYGDAVASISYTMRILCIENRSVYAIHRTMALSLPSVSSCTNCRLVDNISARRKGPAPHLSVPNMDCLLTHDASDPPRCLDRGT